MVPNMYVQYVQKSKIDAMVGFVLILRHMAIQDLFRDQRPSDEESKGGEIAIKIYISSYFSHFFEIDGEGRNLQHGSISYVSELLPPVCFRGLLREGEALEGVWLDVSRDGADAGDD